MNRKKERELQDSNLRGQSPSDFESDSLTTRTNSLGGKWSIWTNNPNVDQFAPIIGVCTSIAIEIKAIILGKNT